MNFIFQQFLMLILFCHMSFVAAQISTQDHSPSSLKESLLLIYHDHYVTFFCNQAYTPDKPIQIQYCPHCPSFNASVKWMPIIPLKELVQDKLCYKQNICIDSKGHSFKGIRCCIMHDKYAKKMIHDPHNYVPEIALLAQERRNFKLDVYSDASANSCPFKVDRKQKRCFINPKLSGFVARTYLYMHDKYGLSLTSDEWLRYSTWSKNYPADAWELERERRIETLWEKV